MKGLIKVIALIMAMLCVGQLGAGQTGQVRRTATEAAKKAVPRLVQSGKTGTRGFVTYLKTGGSTSGTGRLTRTGKTYGQQYKVMPESEIQAGLKSGNIIRTMDKAGRVAYYRNVGAGTKTPFVSQKITQQLPQNSRWSSFGNWFKGQSNRAFTAAQQAGTTLRSTLLLAQQRTAQFYATLRNDLDLFLQQLTKQSDVRKARTEILMNQIRQAGMGLNNWTQQIVTQARQQAQQFGGYVQLQADSLQKAVQAAGGIRPLAQAYVNMAFVPLKETVLPVLRSGKIFLTEALSKDAAVIREAAQRYGTAARQQAQDMRGFLKEALSKDVQTIQTATQSYLAAARAQGQAISAHVREALGKDKETLRQAIQKYGTLGRAYMAEANNALQSARGFMGEAIGHDIQTIKRAGQKYGPMVRGQLAELQSNAAYLKQVVSKELEPVYKALQPVGQHMRAALSKDAQMLAATFESYMPKVQYVLGLAEIYGSRGVQFIIKHQNKIYLAAATAAGWQAGSYIGRLGNQVEPLLEGIPYLIPDYAYQAANDVVDFNAKEQKGFDAFAGVMNTLTTKLVQDKEITAREVDQIRNHLKSLNEDQLAAVLDADMYGYSLVQVIASAMGNKQVSDSEVRALITLVLDNSNVSPDASVLMPYGNSSRLTEEQAGTLLKEALLSGRTPVVKLLLEKGASAYNEDQDNNSELIHAQMMLSDEQVGKLTGGQKKAAQKIIEWAQTRPQQMSPTQQMPESRVTPTVVMGEQSALNMEDTSFRQDLPTDEQLFESASDTLPIEQQETTVGLGHGTRVARAIESAGRAVGQYVVDPITKQMKKINPLPEGTITAREYVERQEAGEQVPYQESLATATDEEEGGLFHETGEAIGQKAKAAYNWAKENIAEPVNEKVIQPAAETVNENVVQPINEKVVQPTVEKVKEVYKKYTPKYPSRRSVMEEATAPEWSDWQ